MKKTIIYALAALILASFSGCRRVNCGNEPGGMSFLAEMENIASRGVAIQEDKDFPERMQIFKVWGYLNGSEITSLYDRSVKMFGSKYFPIDADGNYDHVPMPAGADPTNCRFYAVAEDAPKDTTYLDYVNVTYEGLTFKYTAPPVETNPGKVKYHRDAELLKEVLTGVLPSGGIHDNIVPLFFTHPFACVRFRVSEQINKPFKIKRVEINGIRNSGICSVSPDGSISWSDLTPDADRVNYVQIYDFDAEPGFGEDPAKDEYQEVNDVMRSQSWILVPQKFSNPSDSFIKIIFSVFGNEKEAVLPLDGVEWKINNEYWYTISKDGVIYNSQVLPWGIGEEDERQYSEPGIYW